ncbi:MAG: hypothetical protein U0800_14355 [Isosphaeraceae bacterium]
MFPDQSSPASQNSPIAVKVVVPFGHPTPFAAVVDHVKSLGLQVQSTYPQVNAIHGMASLESLKKLQQIPGIAVSPVQKMTWSV